MRFRVCIVATALALLIAGCGSTQERVAYLNGSVAVLLSTSEEGEVKDYFEFSFYRRGTYHVHFEGGEGMFQNFTKTVEGPEVALVHRWSIPEGVVVSISNGFQEESHTFGEE